MYDIKYNNKNCNEHDIKYASGNYNNLKNIKCQRIQNTDIQKKITRQKLEITLILVIILVQPLNKFQVL